MIGGAVAAAGVKKKLPLGFGVSFFWPSFFAHIFANPLLLSLVFGIICTHVFCILFWKPDAFFLSRLNKAFSDILACCVVTTHGILLSLL